MKPAQRFTETEERIYPGFNRDFESPHVLLVARDAAGELQCFALDDHEYARNWLRYVEDTDSPCRFVGLYDQTDPLITLASLIGESNKR